MPEAEDQPSEDTPRRRGRPPGKRGTFSFRVTPVLRRQLEAAAAKSGRPISEEIESRLEQSFWADEIKAQEQKETDRFSAETYMKRIESMCGGREGLDFAVLIGNLVLRLRMKLKLQSDGNVLALSEEDRRSLMRETANGLPPLFSLWDDAWRAARRPVRVMRVSRSK